MFVPFVLKVVTLFEVTFVSYTFELSYNIVKGTEFLEVSLSVPVYNLALRWLCSLLHAVVHLILSMSTGHIFLYFGLFTVTSCYLCQINIFKFCQDKIECLQDVQ
jgi:hypothetical protein